MVSAFLSLGLEGFLQRCSGCSVVLDYGENTHFDRQLAAHVCKSCGQVIK